ncbi:hypothetical protein SNC15_02205, partial [Escherichia coli]|nr:hypothetical protein [Escherichia coli]
MLRDEIAMIVCSPVLLCEQYSGIKTFIKRISRYRTDDFILSKKTGNDSNLLIVFYVQIMPDDFVMQLHR